MDDVLNFLVEDFEEKSHDSLMKDHHLRAARAHARRRAVVTLKLHGLFRSSCCAQMERGSLFSDPTEQSDTSSHWGPMSSLTGGMRCPSWVSLRLSKTKTSGPVTSKIEFLPSEPALCPVANLFTYVQICRKKGNFAEFITAQHCIFTGNSTQREGGVKRFCPITTADPLGRDTKEVMSAAGVEEIYKAHALRAATGSKLLENGANELDIIHHARWSNASVFRTFYERAKHKSLSIADLQKRRVNHDHK